MHLTIEFSPGTAYCDFNAVDEHGRLSVSRSQFNGFGLKRGKLIALRDHEGNSCEAVVEALGARVIETRPYLWTWRDAPQHQIAIERNVYPSRVLSTAESATGIEVPA